MSDGPEVDEAPRYIRAVTDLFGRRFISWKTSEDVLREYYTIDTEDRSPDQIYRYVSPSKRRVERAESDFLNALAWRTQTYMLVVSLLLIFLALLQCMNIISLSVLSYGLTIEVSGAIILGIGLISSPVEVVRKATSGYGGAMPYFRRTLAVDVVDGIWGIALILLGAIISLVSTIQVV